MMNKVCRAIFGVLLLQIINGQCIYTWDKEKISVETAIKMEVY